MPPAASYDVEVFDYGTQTWTSTENTLLCYDFLVNDADHSSYQDCNLHVNAEARAHHMTYMKLKATSTTNPTPESVSADQEM